MGERHSKPIREAISFAGERSQAAADMLFLATLSLAILAGLGLGFIV